MIIDIIAYIVIGILLGIFFHWLEYQIEGKVEVVWDAILFSMFVWPIFTPILIISFIHSQTKKHSLVFEKKVKKNVG